jgi:general secretion pathway protein A
MYESFYHLRSKPFTLLQDNTFLYAGSTHRMAYSTLEYGLVNEAAFMVLTGEPGMGKTSLMRKLVAEYGAQHLIGLVTNARYDIEHILPWVLLSLGLSKRQLDPIEAQYVFSEFLNEESRKHRRVILIIDEAQSLGTDLLEELRLMSNLNDGKTLKLQIILSGQPDLHKLLERIDMTQFAQRVVVDYHLEPFSETETGQYIRHRIQVAGGHLSLFTNKACALVHRLTRGNPRLINQVCDMALAQGMAKQARIITSKVVAQAAFERSKSKILPLASREELIVQVNLPEDAGEKDAHVPELSPRDWQTASPVPGSAAAYPVASGETSPLPDHFLYARGVEMRKEGRLKEAIDLLNLVGQRTPYRLKASVQIGLCQRAAGNHRDALEIFRAALKDASISKTEKIDVQYFLARTLESVGEAKEAAILFRSIARTFPGYKDAAYRANRLSSDQKLFLIGEWGDEAGGSWFERLWSRKNRRAA